ncbi:hypothetical protein [Acinetobacter indicus]|nr:hypothetical protein [Acinetobacter indicus]
MPDQVASVLTVGGANQGTVVASDVMKFADQQFWQSDYVGTRPGRQYISA